MGLGDHFFQSFSQLEFSPRDRIMLIVHLNLKSFSDRYFYVPAPQARDFVSFVFLPSPSSNLIVLQVKSFYFKLHHLYFIRTSFTYCASFNFLTSKYLLRIWVFSHRLFNSRKQAEKGTSVCVWWYVWQNLLRCWPPIWTLLMNTNLPKEFLIFKI